MAAYLLIAILTGLTGLVLFLLLHVGFRALENLVGSLQ